MGGLANELSEGDVICVRTPHPAPAHHGEDPAPFPPQVMSQWGEIEDFNMPREKKTGKPRGWAWVKYEDQRSTILVGGLRGGLFGR